MSGSSYSLLAGRERRRGIDIRSTGIPRWANCDLAYVPLGSRTMVDTSTPDEWSTAGTNGCTWEGFASLTPTSTQFTSTALASLRPVGLHSPNFLQRVTHLCNLMPPVSQSGRLYTHSQTPLRLLSTWLSRPSVSQPGHDPSPKLPRLFISISRSTFPPHHSPSFPGWPWSRNTSESKIFSGFRWKPP